MKAYDTVDQWMGDAKAIAWDTCHKIYLLMDDAQVEAMRGYGYEMLITKDQMTEDQMTAQVIEWYEQSCGLRFVEAVETTAEGEDPNLGFTSLIPQGYSEGCDDCGEKGCHGVCNDLYDPDEDDYYDEDEDEDEEDEE